jgi:putative DNA primase/helicase
MPLIVDEAIPRELLDSSRAVLWNYVEVPDRPKPTKVPYQVRRPETKAAVNDAATWGEMREAILAAADGKADGVGIVLGDGLVGVDLDHCRDPQTGELADEAQRIIRALHSYTEVSPSGTGVHILLRGTLPPGRRRAGAVEMYSDGRYFTVSGQHVAGTPRTIEDRHAELGQLHARLFPAPAPVSTPAPGVTASDTALLALAARASNGARFSALWDGDTSAYNGDDSAADLALCNLLSFWTDRDSDRIDRLFRQSGLMREKWDTRRGAQTYGDLTIARALEGCTEGYTGSCRAGAAPPTTDPASSEGFPIDELEDATVVAQRGREIDAAGIPYLLDGIVPNLGMLGFVVAYAKGWQNYVRSSPGRTSHKGRRFSTALPRRPACSSWLLKTPRSTRRGSPGISI